MDTAFAEASPGDVLLDTERALYSGAKQNPLQAALSLGLYRNILKMYSDGNRKAVGGNQRGDFRYLGGVLVFGPGDSGIVYQWHEQAMGDSLDHSAILGAIASLSTQSKL
mmetsp:Transcript_482/g.1562  ORF Transcript_482/g.1562 Transcript_482/m.1562 type:complete len:110 (-) Transcript_482:119-448(-)